MLYKNGKKFIFVHIPKNAGNTVRQSVFKLPNDDVKLISHIENGTQFSSIINEHLTYDEHLKKYSEHNPEGIFSFCFLRNPYERFISIYNYLSNENFLTSGSKVRRETAKLFLKVENPLKALTYLKENPNHSFFEDRHGYLQSDYIGKGKKVDFIGTVETFEKSINRIFTVLELKEEYQIQKLNTGTGRFIDLLSNTDYIHLIDYLYKKDIELYNTIAAKNNK